MADDDQLHLSRFDASPPLAWGQTPQGYPHQPHSHHGTPATEYSGFNFSPSLPMEPAAAHHHHHHHHRPMAVLPQLSMPLPQWPSEMGRQSSYVGFPTMYAPQLQTVLPPMPVGGMPTPVSATTTTPTRPGSTPRRTLTDADRKRMCQYAAEHPTAKQTDIAKEFHVERSTVSKVLRQKEKYLCQDNGSQSPIKRAKGKSPDIERALSVWAKNSERKGVSLTDDMLREKLRAFSATTTTPEDQAGFSTSWLEKFKLKYNLMGARSRKGSLAPDDIDLTSAAASASHTPNGTSPLLSPRGGSITPPTELHSAESHESLKQRESPESYADYATRHGPFHHSQSATSLNSSAFTDTAPSSFSPGPLSPTSPFFTPDSGTAPGPFLPPGPRPLLPAACMTATTTAAAAAAAAAGHGPFRPRSQTFPQLDQFGVQSAVVSTTAAINAAAMTTCAADSTTMTTTAKYQAHVPLDSPMQSVDPLMDMTHAMTDRPSTVLPSDTMGPPPLPSSLLTADMQHLHQSRHQQQQQYDGGGIGSAQSRSPASMASLISAEEARRAFEIVLTFCEQQPAGFLEFQESLSFGRVKEKLYFSRRGST